MPKTARFSSACLPDFQIRKTNLLITAPDTVFVIWPGGMRGRMGSSTVGQRKLVDALPPDVWERRDQFVEDDIASYDALPPAKRF